MKRTKNFGPFNYYRNSWKGISAWIKGHQDSPYGWEWGNDPYNPQAYLTIRIGPLMLIHVEKLIEGWELILLGFWCHL